MRLIVDKSLQEMYEVLTKTPFVTDDGRPMLACYICCARLHNSYKLAKSCLHSEELFQQMLNTDETKKREEQLHCTKTFGIMQVVHLSCPGKLEDTHPSYSGEPDSTNGKTAIDDIELKLELKETAVKSELYEQQDSFADVIQQSHTNNDPLGIPSLDNTHTHAKCEPGLATQSDKCEDVSSKLQNIYKTNIKPKETSSDRLFWNNMSEKKGLQCDLCGKLYCNKSYLAQHIRTHVIQPFECSVCKKCFGQKSHLKTHFRTHTGDYQFECEVCGKCFTRRSNLLLHMRTHTGEKPFECYVCKKHFRLKGHLENHCLTHTGYKQFKCEVCTKRFSRKAHLCIHMHVHTGEKPFECNVCKKYFTQKFSVVLHMRTHTGEKPFECDVCKKCFRQKIELVRHMRTHR